MSIAVTVADVELPLDPRQSSINVAYKAMDFFAFLCNALLLLALLLNDGVNMVLGAGFPVLDCRPPPQHGDQDQDNLNDVSE